MTRRAVALVSGLAVVTLMSACAELVRFRSSTSAASPSGVAMPVGNLHGWRQVMVDDFNGSVLDGARWGTYSGPIPGDDGGWWSPSHVTLARGVATLGTFRDAGVGNRWVSGGMSSARALTQQYGKYMVRFRMDRSVGVKYAILLWPSTRPWPCGGEIDFGEDNGGSHSRSTLTVHYCNPDGSDAILPQLHVKADFSHWHTIGVEWTRDSIVWTLDGRRIGRVSSVHVPSSAMELDIQTQAGTCGDPEFPCPDRSTPRYVRMQVDWVVAYTGT
jgi:beta-glucanase (GH16 family)